MKLINFKLLIVFLFCTFLYCKSDTPCVTGWDEYNLKGEPKSVIVHESDQVDLQPGSIWEITFSENGNIQEEKLFTPDTISEDKKFYYVRDCLDSMTETKENGNVCYKYLFKGNETRIKYNDRDTILEHWKNNKKISEETKRSNGSLFTSKSYQYDTYGNLVLQHDFLDNGNNRPLSVLIWKYEILELDSLHNWTLAKKSATANNQFAIEYYIKRIIDYHK